MEWEYPSSNEHIKRTYQVEICEQALLFNTLVCLPTGLGKTLIAAVELSNYRRWFPSRKVIFLAPTKPLVAQQCKAFQHLLRISDKDIALMEGSITKEKRSILWDSHFVFFSTPQTFVNDIQTYAVSTKDFSLVVFDEAHRASGEYAYCQVMRLFNDSNSSSQLRVLALSATPGADKRTIQNVISNLNIEHIEVRTEEDPEILAYTNYKLLEFINVGTAKRGSLDDRVASAFYRLLQPCVDRLSCYNVFVSDQVETVTPMIVQEAQDRLEALRYRDASLVATLQPDFQAVATLISWRSVFKMQGAASLRREIEREARSACGSSVSSAGVASLTRLLGGEPDEHRQVSDPKLEALKDTLMEHFARRDASSRVIVFVHLRTSVSQIVSQLRLLDCVRPKEFIGQGSKSSGGNAGGTIEGLTQKEQKEILVRFNAGEYNTLVATCIAEEGLDISDVDLMYVVCGTFVAYDLVLPTHDASVCVYRVFFDNTSSPVRTVQRMGRTGRKQSGRIVVLVASEEERDKAERGCRGLKNVRQLLRDDNFRMFTKGSLAIEQPLTMVDRYLGGPVPTKGPSKVCEPAGPRISSIFNRVCSAAPKVGAAKASCVICLAATSDGSDLCVSCGDVMRESVEQAAEVAVATELSSPPHPSSPLPVQMPTEKVSTPSSGRQWRALNTADADPRRALFCEEYLALKRSLKLITTAPPAFESQPETLPSFRGGILGSCYRGIEAFNFQRLLPQVRAVELKGKIATTKTCKDTASVGRSVTISPVVPITSEAPSQLCVENEGITLSQSSFIQLDDDDYSTQLSRCEEPAHAVISSPVVCLHRVEETLATRPSSRLPNLTRPPLRPIQNKFANLSPLTVDSAMASLNSVPASSLSQSAPSPDMPHKDVPCCICTDLDSYDDNPIVLCDGACNEAAHLHCYGLLRVPSGAFYCEACGATGQASAPVCYVCRGSTGMMKRSTCGQWTHPTCVVFTPELTVSDSQRANNLSCLNKERERVVCLVCRRSRAVQCCVDACYCAFHPYCAFTNGARLVIRTKAGDDASLVYEIYCPQHLMTLEALSSDAIVSTRPSTELSKGVQRKIEGRGIGYHDSPFSASDQSDRQHLTHKRKRLVRRKDLPNKESKADNKNTHNGFVKLCYKGDTMAAKVRAAEYVERECDVSSGSDSGDDGSVSEGGSVLSGDFINDGSFTQPLSSQEEHPYLLAHDTDSGCGDAEDIFSFKFGHKVMRLPRLQQALNNGVEESPCMEESESDISYDASSALDDDDDEGTVVEGASPLHADSVAFTAQSDASSNRFQESFTHIDDFEVDDDW